MPLLAWDGFGDLLTVCEIIIITQQADLIWKSNGPFPLADEVFRQHILISNFYSP